MKSEKPTRDELIQKLVCAMRAEIGEVLTQIFNKSMQTGDVHVVPREWRDALIVSLFKKKGTEVTDATTDQ